MHDYLELSAEQPIDWVNRVPEELKVDADPEQLFRVVFNLCRNSVQALTQQAEENTRTMLTGMFSALDIQLTVVGD